MNRFESHIPCQNDANRPDNPDRRKFLRRLGAVTLAGLTYSTPLSLLAAESDEKNSGKKTSSEDGGASKSASYFEEQLSSEVHEVGGLYFHGAYDHVINIGVRHENSLLPYHKKVLSKVLPKIDIALLEFDIDRGSYFFDLAEFIHERDIPVRNIDTERSPVLEYFFDYVFLKALFSQIKKMRAAAKEGTWDLALAATTAWNTLRGSVGFTQGNIGYDSMMNFEKMRGSTTYDDLSDMTKALYATDGRSVGMLLRVLEWKARFPDKNILVVTGDMHAQFMAQYLNGPISEDKLDELYHSMHAITSRLYRLLSTDSMHFEEDHMHGPIVRKYLSRDS